jgi:hypothetical protein
VKSAGELLQQAGIEVKVKAIGIAENEVKRTPLRTVGARIESGINTALASLDHF